MSAIITLAMLLFGFVVMYLWSANRADVRIKDEVQIELGRVQAVMTTTRTGIKLYRDIAVQAPTTYKWKWQSPQFKVLPGEAHGTFDERLNV